MFINHHGSINASKEGLEREGGGRGREIGGGRGKKKGASKGRKHAPFYNTVRDLKSTSFPWPEINLARSSSRPKKYKYDCA